MNLARFHSAIYRFVSEYEVYGVAEKFNTLVGNLRSSAAAQTDAASAEFKAAYSELLDTLDNSWLSIEHPTRRKALEEIGAEQFYGKILISKIKSAISSNNVTPSLAIQELESIQDGLVEYHGKLKTIDGIFTDLKIEFERIYDGEFEVGVSIPKEVAGNNLLSISDEIRHINNTLLTLSEISTGSREPLTAKEISASEWQFFIDVAGPLAACTAVAIERIVELYKKNLEIKLLKKQLEDKVPDDALASLREHIDTSVAHELRKISDDLVDEFYVGGDDERKNELKNAASISLKYFADRIDNGATIEVRAFDEGEVDSGETEDEGFPKLVEYSRRVIEASQKTYSFERSEEPILYIEKQELPEGEVDS